MIEVTGSLQEKNNIYQAVLSFKQDGKWKTKWASTKIKALKKNRTLAEIELEKIKNNFQHELNKNNFTNKYTNITENIKNTETENVEKQNQDITFIDFMKDWLKMIKPSIEETTYYGYSKAINGNMTTYFKNKNITLQEIKTIDIQKFYQYLIEKGLTANTIRTLSCQH